ncbi:hypothetical protein GGR57DRAFT_193024 [Xylariaceae sp. FL1272]|nr:hypothetical protein GGR57DRAFT_193024 [Xylariaceae sp. FL1272]
MSSGLVTIPAELRLMIYAHLFYTGDAEQGKRKRLSIRNDPRPSLITTSEPSRLRKRYYVIGRTLHRQCYETTYTLVTKPATLCASIMCVNRLLYDETAAFVYGEHIFDFGSDAEAVAPFLSDLTPASRNMIKHIELSKAPHYDSETDRFEWRAMCMYLRDHALIETLRLVVQAGRPSCDWVGPKEMSCEELGLLLGLRFECLDWITQVATLKGLRDIEIVPEYVYAPPPQSTNMIVGAALAGSIENGLTTLLRRKLGLPDNQRIQAM